LNAPARHRDDDSRSRPIAAFLSFVWPGLGHWYLGRGRSALVYAAPAVLVLIVLALEASRGLSVFAIRLLDPSFSLTLLILVILLGVWRLIAIVDTGLPRRRGSSTRVTTTWILLAIVVGMHGAAGFYVHAFYQAGARIFVGEDPRSDHNPVSNPNATPEPSDVYNVPPFATPSTPEGRVTVLLTGVDKSTDRTHSLTDTILVASLDPETGAMSMVSFPRDIAGFPLFDGGTYRGKINSFMSWAAGQGDRYPDGPLPALAKELGFLLGIQINYFAAVDLDGFQLMIEAVGGVTIDVDRRISDPGYIWLDGGPRGFYLEAGRQTLDARTALAYVRSRMGVGDNDFTRADRQQRLLLALRTQMTDPANIGRLPAVLDAASRTIRTNFPPERLGDTVATLQETAQGAIRRVVLQPPTYSVHPPTSSTGGTYTLRLHLDALRKLSVELFGEDSDFWTGTFDADGSPIPRLDS
jgi:LCP family protein required for cell wall assembly